MSVRRVPNGFSDKPNKFIIELLCGCAYLFDVIDMIDMINMIDMIDMFFNMIDTYNWYDSIQQTSKSGDVD